MSLESALETLEELGRAAERAGTALSAGSGDAAMQRAIQYALDRITPMARGMLLANLDGSGIGKAKGDDLHGYKPTGKLREAVQGTVLFLNRKRSKIVAAMPKGLAGYDEGTSIYKVAQVLSSGAVHAPHAVRNLYDLSLAWKTSAGRTAAPVVGKTKRSVWGERAKKTLKKFALSGKAPSRQSEVWLGGMAKAPWGYKGKEVFPGGKLEKKGETGKGSVSLGHGVSVIRARHFFEFRADQQAKLSEQFGHYLRQYLNGGVRQAQDAAAGV